MAIAPAILPMIELNQPELTHVFGTTLGTGSIRTTFTSHHAFPRTLQKRPHDKRGLQNRRQKQSLC